MTPVQARLVLAQRAGVEDYHSADLLGDGVVECINHYGAEETLFGSGKGKVQGRRAMILANGMKDEICTSCSVEDAVIGVIY